jgi:hypothetical protein
MGHRAGMERTSVVHCTMDVLFRVLFIDQNECRIPMRRSAWVLVGDGVKP